MHYSVLEHRVEPLLTDTPNNRHLLITYNLLMYIKISPTNCYESRQEPQTHKAQQVSRCRMDRLGYRLASLDVHTHARMHACAHKHTHKLAQHSVTATTYKLSGLSILQKERKKTKMTKLGFHRFQVRHFGSNLEQSPCYCKMGQRQRADRSVFKGTYKTHHQAKYQRLNANT